MLFETQQVYFHQSTNLSKIGHCQYRIEFQFASEIAVRRENVSHNSFVAAGG